MKIVHTSIPDVVIVESPLYHDTRGFFTEVFHEARFAELGLPTHFAQDNHSRSVRHVLRGLHYQLSNPQGKLVRVARGQVFDVAVDLRAASPTFRRWVGVILDEASGKQLYVPPGFAHGFLVLSDVADVSYKCTTRYDAASDRSVRWNDPAIDIAWPIPEHIDPIISPKDRDAPLLADAATFP